MTRGCSKRHVTNISTSWLGASGSLCCAQHLLQTGSCCAGFGWGSCDVGGWYNIVKGKIPELQVRLSGLRSREYISSSLLAVHRDDSVSSRQHSAAAS